MDIKAIFGEIYECESCHIGKDLFLAAEKKNHFAKTLRHNIQKNPTIFIPCL